jgi:hypothetical protein
MSTSNGGDAALFQVRNHHSAECGIPPHINDVHPNQYQGYLRTSMASRPCSSMTVTPAKPSCTWATQAGRCHTTVVDGGVPDLVLSEIERLWVRACWQAATANRKEV